MTTPLCCNFLDETLGTKVEHTIIISTAVIREAYGSFGVVCSDWTNKGAYDVPLTGKNNAILLKVV